MSGCGHWEQMPEDHVTILLCTRNGMPWLPEQLQSLLGQEHENWSLWVSDDGSQDGTLGCLEDFAARHPGRVARIVSGPGAGSAANFLSLLCHPELPVGLTALCDQDDVWLPQRLSRAVSALRMQDDRPAAWAARYVFCDDNLARGAISRRWTRPPGFPNALLQNILSGHTLTLNAAALRLVASAGPRAVPHHDWWIYLLLSGAGARILHDDEAVLLYRQHDQNTVGAQRGLQARIKRLRWLVDGTFRDWNRRNLLALGEVREMLTPASRDILDQWSGLPRWGPLSRLRRFRALGFRRQGRIETLAVMAAVLAGRI